MSENNIVELYANGLSIRQISEIVSFSPFKVRKIILSSGVMRSSRDGLCLRKQNNVPINKELKHVIEGELLGDGCINKGKAQSRFSFNNHDLNYSNWLSDIFIKNGVGLNGNGVRKNVYFHKYWKKYYTNYSFSTTSTKQFHELEKKWYKNRIKVLPDDIKLSPISVLHWYIGDGTLSKNGSANFCTDNFTKNEVEILSKKINLVVKIKSVPFKYLEHYRIFVPKTSVKTLLEYMGSPPFETISYKWELKEIGKINVPIDIEKDDLCELYINENMSRAKIAEIFNCSKVLIEKKLWLFGISKRESNRKYNFNYNELYNLYINKGATQNELANHYGCSIQTIMKRLKEFGIRKTNRWRNYED